MFQELKTWETEDPEDYALNLRASYGTLAAAGAHYVVDDITGLPRVIDDINRRLYLLHASP